MSGIRCGDAWKSRQHARQDFSSNVNHLQIEACGSVISKGRSDSTLTCLSRNSRLSFGVFFLRLVETFLQGDGHSDLPARDEIVEAACGRDRSKGPDRDRRAWGARGIVHIIGYVLIKIFHLFFRGFT